MNKENSANPSEMPESLEAQEVQETAEAAEAQETAEAETAEAQEAGEDGGATEAETFALTREQMEQMEALAGQMAELNDRHLRLLAEYNNYRKRTQKEKEGTYQEAKIDTVVKFLEIYDNLERAATQEGDEDNVHKKGMVMIFHQFQGVLEKLGVTEIDPMGEAFDPERHNAVLHIEDENLGESVVSQVFQKGFLLGNRVIRFATVQVAN
jgi:molecular chaperone GrpE